jgi:hypothetical protein
MSDPAGPTEWERANKGKAKEAFGRAKEAREPLEGRSLPSQPSPPPPSAIRNHGMRPDPSPPSVKRKIAESYAAKDKTEADRKAKSLSGKISKNKSRNQDKNYIKSKDDKDIDKA